MHPVLPNTGEGGPVRIRHHAKPGPLVFDVVALVGSPVRPRVNTESMELAFHKLEIMIEA